MPTLANSKARGLRLGDEEYFKIAAIAMEEERTVNSQIVYIIKKYLKKYEAENGPIDISHVDEILNV